MDVAARLTSKGQVTIPRAVRDALDLRDGDHVLFRVHEDRAVLARTPDLLDLAGTIPVPATRAGTDWRTIRRETRNTRASTT